MLVCTNNLKVIPKGIEETGKVPKIVGIKKEAKPLK